MENVTQKYLRNEYATIEEYNAVAGEVAEPYRVLVVADFPANFDEKAAAPAGRDRRQRRPLRRPDARSPSTPTGRCPPGFPLDDLRPHCRQPRPGTDGRLAWDDPDFGRYPARRSTRRPPAEFATRLIQRVGAAARDAKRVEVPFEFIAPPPDAYWTARQPRRDRRPARQGRAPPSGST